jgi:hypothetical protein
VPTYRHVCPEDHVTMQWRSIHEETVREIPCEVCSRIAVLHLASPAIAADALPNKLHGVRAANARESQWDKDMPAYYRLRKEGLQPKSVDGAHLVEQEARDPLEVTIGRPLGEHINYAKELNAELKQNKPVEMGELVGKALRGEGAL